MLPPARLALMLHPRLLLCLLLAVAACDGGETPGAGCPTTGGIVTATVDGLPFTATCVVAARTDDGFGFVADDRSGAVSTILPRRELSFDVPAAVGTYRLGGSTDALAYFSLIPPGGAPFRYAADSGSVVVEAVTGRRYQGRFSFRTGTRTSNEHTVGSGRFDVTLQGN